MKRIYDQDTLAVTNETAPASKAKPNGAPLASLMGAAIGSVALGALTVLTEWRPKIIKPAMILNNGVGPLSGKTTFAVVAFLFSWVILHASIGRKNVDEKAWLRMVMILIAASLVMTFPPFFQLFTVAP